MKTNNIVIKVLLFTTAITILVYWILVFLKIFPVTELVAGYVKWFMSFPIADSWILLTSVVSLIKLYGHRNSSAAPWLAATGSALIFLGIYGFTYGYLTGLLFNLTFDEIIEIMIKIYCLAVGGYFIYKATTLGK